MYATLIELRSLVQCHVDKLMFRGRVTVPSAMAWWVRQSAEARGLAVRTVPVWRGVQLRLVEERDDDDH